MGHDENGERDAAWRHLSVSFRRLKIELRELFRDPLAMMGLVLIAAVVYAVWIKL